MRTPGFISKARLAGRALAAVIFASLVVACADADDVGEATDDEVLGGGAGAPPAAGGAPGVPLDTGGAGPGPNDAGGAFGAGGDPGGFAGAVGAGGQDPFGAGGMPGAGGMDVGAAGAPGTGVPPQATCNPILNGLSSVVVNGVVRQFSVRLPADTSRMALLFLWHGFLQVPDTFANEVVYDVVARRWVPFDPNAFPMPLMIVTPYDTKLLPPLGLDWDIVSGEKDFPFFEAMLGCIQQQYSIDDTRLYSFGFSAGAVFTNLLTAKYPNLFAATVAESGAWFNDQAQWSDVTIPVMQWKWPAFNPADGGNVLLSHGGPQDFATVISLENANRKALPFLKNNGRTVTECFHTFGHTLVPDLTQGMIYEWLWAHQRGGPPLSGLPPSFPAPGRPVGATTCVFHPAP